MAEKFANDFSTTLAGSATAGATTISVSVAAPAALQSGEFRVRIDNELLLVTGGQSTTTWTVTRAAEGTTAASHANGATVDHVLTVDSLAAAAVQSGPQPQTQRLAVFGHSGAEPYGIPMPDSWAQKAGRLLGAEVVNYALSGAVLSLDDGAGASTTASPSNGGGYATVLNGCLPFTKGVGTGGARAIRTAAPYLTFADLYGLFYGANDLYVGSTTVAQNVAIVGRVLRGLIAGRCQAGAVYNDDNQPTSVFTYSTTPAWTTFARGVNNQATTYGSFRQASTVNAYFDMAVPADFPGGEIVFMFGAGSNFGGKWTVTEGATQVGQLDLTGGGYHGTRVSLVPLRVTGLTAGAHTLRVTLTTITGSSNQGSTVTAGVFDSAAIRVPADRLPGVVLFTHPYGPGVTTADIDLLNNEVRAIAAEFTDGSVSVCDVQANWNATNEQAKTFGLPNSLFLAPGAANHPNALGHARVVEQFLDTVRRMPRRIARPSDSAPHWRQVGFWAALPNGWEPPYKASWTGAASGSGATQIFGAEFSKTASQIVNLRGQVKKSAAMTGGGDNIFTLPPQYRPAETQFFSCPAGSAISNLNIMAVIRVDTAGNVAYYSSSGTIATNGVIDLSPITFPADGGSNP